MTPATVQLGNILAMAYESRMLGRGDGSNALALFTRQVGIDPNFLATAKARLSDLERMDTRRCVVSKVHKDFLEMAVEAAKEIRQ